MKRLRNLRVKEVSLVKNPANMKKFIVYKSADKGGAMPKQSDLEAAVRNADPKVLAVIEKAVKARRDVAKAEGDGDDGAAAAEDAGLSPQAQTMLKAIGRIVASGKDDLTVADIMAVCQAAGLEDGDVGDADDVSEEDPQVDLSEDDTCKAEDDADMEDMDADKAEDADADAGEDGDMEVEMSADKPDDVTEDDHAEAMAAAKKAYMDHAKKKQTKAEGDPAAEEAEPVPGEDKGGKVTTKSATRKAGQGAASDALREIQKAQKLMDETNKILVKKNAKLEMEIKAERDYRVMKSIEKECAQEFSDLGIDTTQVATVLKSMKDAGQTEAHDQYVAVLKAANAQVALSKSVGGNIYGSMGRTVNPTEATGASAKLEALVDSSVQKSTSGKSRPEIYSAVLETPEGRALYNEMVRERNN